MAQIDMEVEKFLEYQLGKRITDRNKDKRRLLHGTFKEEGSDKVHTGDNFLAYELSHCSASQVYECYVFYYNHTLRHGEKVRVAISAEWAKGVS